MAIYYKNIRLEKISEEFMELNTKIAKAKFESATRELDKQSKKLLDKQIDAMIDYSNILLERSELIKFRSTETDILKEQLENDNK